MDIFEILRKVDKQRHKADKVKVLKENETWALKDIIRGSMDSNIKWKLPGGTPPYTPCEEHNYPASLHREHKQFVYFVQGQNKCESLPAYKREKLFLGMLEGIHPQDALVLIDMINKKTPKGITRPIVEEAFPGLLTD